MVFGSLTGFFGVFTPFAVLDLPPSKSAQTDALVGPPWLSKDDISVWMAPPLMFPWELPA